MQEVKQLWEKVLEKLEMLVTAVSYDLWIKPIRIVDFQDGKTLVLVASSSTAEKQILKNHLGEFKTAIAVVFGNETEFKILDPAGEAEYLKKNKPEKNQTVEENKNDHLKSPFNEKYTFDNFVVGNSNRVVYAASRAVAENPAGGKFNPLFIYGGVGLGKTHLLHAIGNYIREFSKNMKVCYITCEKFTNEYIDLIRFGKDITSEFREKYRNLDVLMIDDIQFISNKTSTQEEFFHTFNDLYQNGKQIIISSDRPPKEIATLEDRLRSRFASGLIQDIQTPDFETRIAILRKKAQQERYVIDENVIEFIAEKVDTNIREMEGLLSKVFFFATLLGKKSATLEEAHEAFKEQQEDRKSDISPEKIISKVCEYFDVSKQEIAGKKKSKDIVEPRMIAIYLISEILDMPLINIGKLFGGRDHTTIIHARDKITEEMKNNNKTKTIVNELRNRLND